MKIAFNGINCGFGNNGGTQTNFRTANKLAELGCNVNIYSSSSNQFTWFKLHPTINYHITKSPPKEYFDVVFMCGFKTYNSTKKFNSKLKINWIRGWETWSNNEDQMIKICNDKDFLQWTNSTWIRNYLAKYNIEATIVYPGIPNDFYEYIPEKREKLKQKILNNSKLTIGILNTSRHSSPKKGYQISKQICKQLKSDFNIVGFGNNEKDSIFNYYIKQPNNKQKRNLYNLCDIWLVTSTNEGLHIPPMEASLCGAMPILPNDIRSGYIDWYPTEILKISNNEYIYANVNEAISKIKQSKYNENNLNSLYWIKHNINTKINDVNINVDKMVKIIQNKMR